MKNGIYRLVYINGDMMEILLQTYLADIDYKTSSYKDKEELLEEFGYPKEGELLIVGNKGVKYGLPVVYDNINVKRVAASSLGTTDINVLKKEVSDMIEIVRNNLLFRDFLIQNDVLDEHTGLQIDRYKKYRDIAYYYDVYTKPNRIHSFIISYIFKTHRFDEIKKVTELIFGMNEQELFDEGFITLDENGRILPVFEPEDMLDALLLYKNNRRSLRHDPSGMMSGNMVGIDIPEINPNDGTIIKKKRSERR